MLSIDRFEGAYAVCIDDNGRVVNLEKRLLQDNAKEGDIIYQKNGRYFVSEEKTKSVRDEISALQDELFE